MHHRHQLREASEELAIEMEENRKITADDLDPVRLVEAKLKRNMALLLEHRAKP